MMLRCSAEVLRCDAEVLGCDANVLRCDYEVLRYEFMVFSQQDKWHSNFIYFTFPHSTVPDTGDEAEGVTNLYPQHQLKHQTQPS